MYEPSIPPGKAAILFLNKEARIVALRLLENIFGKCFVNSSTDTAWLVDYSHLWETAAEGFCDSVDSFSGMALAIDSSYFFSTFKRSMDLRYTTCGFARFQFNNLIIVVSEGNSQTSTRSIKFVQPSEQPDQEIKDEFSDIHKAGKHADTWEAMADLITRCIQEERKERLDLYEEALAGRCISFSRENSSLIMFNSSLQENASEWYRS